jgi:hypothetical protein
MESQAVRQLAEIWERCRPSGGVPSYEALEREPEFTALAPNCSVLEVRSTSTLLVVRCGPATADYVGFDMTGRDLINITPQDYRALRFQRYRRVAEIPCGMQFMEASPIHGLLLPVRYQEAEGRHILGLYCFSPEETGPVTQISGRVVYLDLGFGLPSRIDDPVAHWPEV